MTPKFTTNCILITKNIDTINYVVQKLIEMGRRDFTPNCFEVGRTRAILAFSDCFTLSMNTSSPPPVERCTDIETFIDLAGMREDTDKEQWLVHVKRDNDFVKCSCHEFGYDNFRHATAAEIIAFLNTDNLHEK